MGAGAPQASATHAPRRRGGRKEALPQQVRHHQRAGVALAVGTGDGAGGGRGVDRDGPPGGAEQREEAVHHLQRVPPRRPAAPQVAQRVVADATQRKDAGVVERGRVEGEDDGDAEVGEEVGVEGRAEMPYPAVLVDVVAAVGQVGSGRGEEEETARHDGADPAVLWPGAEFV